MANILIVEDNDKSARLIKLALHGHLIERVSSAVSAYRKLDRLADSLDVIIVDRHLSPTGNTLDASGDDVIEYALDHYPDIARIMITAAPRPGDVDDIKSQFGLSALLLKTEQGYGAPGLRRAVERALLSRENASRDATKEAFSLIVTRLEGEFTTQRTGLEREMRAKERERAPGWREAVAALHEAVRQLDGEQEQMAADAKNVSVHLDSASSRQAANDIILSFSARWDA